MQPKKKMGKVSLHNMEDLVHGSSSPHAKDLRKRNI